MTAIEWALLELLMSADPAAQVSAVVVVATVVAVFAGAALAFAVARAMRAVRRAGLAGHTAPRRIGAAREGEPPNAVVRCAPMTGRPGARAPGDLSRRSLRTA